METIDKTLNYERIAKAISFIKENYQQQPSLDDIADHIHLSPFHFQRLFQEWAGTTPKKFLQYISLSHAKEVLKKSLSISDTTYQLGLSSSSRLHDLFIQIEGMSPSEYRDGGKNLCIEYSTAHTNFGLIIIASTTKGICHIAFFEVKEKAIQNLLEQFPNATFVERCHDLHKKVVAIFDQSAALTSPIHLHIKGTAFQLKVWEALLKIPAGNLMTYGQIASLIEQPTASRAVGTAIGSNPIAFLIPCHRVIQATGVFGGYMWNPIRKTAIIGWETVKSHHDETI